MKYSKMLFLLTTSLLTWSLCSCEVNDFDLSLMKGLLNLREFEDIRCVSFGCEFDDAQRKAELSISLDLYISASCDPSKIESDLATLTFKSSLEDIPLPTEKSSWWLLLKSEQNMKVLSNFKPPFNSRVYLLDNKSK